MTTPSIPGGMLARELRTEVLRERPEAGVPQEVLDRAARLPERTIDPDEGLVLPDPELPARDRGGRVPPRERDHRDDAGGTRRPGRGRRERPAPGGLGIARTIDDRQLTGLVRDAVGSGRIRWLARGGEAVVLRDVTRAASRSGVVVVGMTLQTDQTGEQELTVPFAVGSATRDAGLLATTHRVPDGHVQLARAFGEAVVATAWQALLAVAVGVAAAAGTSTTGRTLQPALLRAAPGRLTVVPRAPENRAPEDRE